MIGLHITTLGCKLNQFDSAELAGSLRGAVALQEDPAGARLVVVNTCTVTSAADSDARQILRRRRRESPEALIVATGCYAEREPSALMAMPEVDLVLRREDRPEAARLVLEALRARFPGEMADGCAERLVGDDLPDFGERTRAFLRVQEGCDLRCSYCIIPQVRGVSRSVAPDLVEGRFQKLIQAGFMEVVLTGVNTGDYGKDLDPSLRLTDLLARLARLPGEFRIRLNSIEPLCVTPELVDLIASEPRLARHLQIPIQSGSDRVLGGMRRNYRTRQYAGVVETLRSRVPDIGLGADVIVGFPGETAADFEATVDFISGSPLNYLHVFSYSSRPGTAAAARPGHVPPETIKERSQVLRRLGADIASAFRRSQVGRPLRALVLHHDGIKAVSRALTSNFIDVALRGRHRENSFVDAVITDVDDSGQTIGQVTGEAQLSAVCEQRSTMR